MEIESSRGSSPDETQKGCLFSIGPTPGSPLKRIPPESPYIPTAAGEVEDLSPPNSVKAEHLNGLSIPLSASAGWSKSPPRGRVYPSSISYDMRLITSPHERASDSLELTAAMEFENPKAEEGESMMVRVVMTKTLVRSNNYHKAAAATTTKTQALELVATQFQEYVEQDNNSNHNKWVDITADVEYTETATAVVDAVLNDPHSGQTAGMATSKPDSVELRLGPFGKKARLIVTFQVESLYSYEAMSVSPDAADIGSHRLVPLWVALPFAPVDQGEAGLSSLSVRLTAPAGTTVLSLEDPCSSAAYHHLKQQDLMKSTTMLAVTELVQLPKKHHNEEDENSEVGYHLEWGTLPPRSCGVLAWLSLPNPTLFTDEDYDFVNMSQDMDNLCIVNDNDTRGKAVLQVPSAEDVASLQVPLPGHGPQGSLWRVHLTMPKAEQAARNVPLVLMNLTLSDKSGSTGRRVANGGVTMRQRFNELAESRFLKRLESIPGLVQAGILRPEDVWMDVFLAFDSQAPVGNICRVIFRVGDITDSIQALVQDIRRTPVLQPLDSITPQNVMIATYVNAIRQTVPGGTTDFSVGPATIMQQYETWKREALLVLRSSACFWRTFVEFDTDGGHNRNSDYLRSLQHLCEVSHVANGVVTGFGSWLNQDCASKVAKVLGPVPAQLALEIPPPGAEGLNHIFRRSFSAWVAALRQPAPLKVVLSAGSVSFPSPPLTEHTRTSNSIEVLALRRCVDRDGQLPNFGAPDVSNENYTATVIERVPPGDELIVYIFSRLQSTDKLARALNICVSNQGTAAAVTDPKNKVRVHTEREKARGTFLAFDWLKMLCKHSGGGTNVFKLSPLLATSLCLRLEDEVSFRFNLASPSGRTSFLGRCKTVANRAAIDSDHQPELPKPAFKFMPPSSERIQGLFQMMDGGADVPSGRGKRRSETLPTEIFTDMCLGSVPRKCGRYSESTAIFETPLWDQTMLVPVGSPARFQESHDTLSKEIQVIAAVRLTLLRDPKIEFLCDICHRELRQDETRYHCFDCDDFDACSDCRQYHTQKFHRINRISPLDSPEDRSEEEEEEDPLVEAMLGPKETAASPCETDRPEKDRAVEWNELKLKRFLLSVLHWWPVLRATFSYCDRLPPIIVAPDVEERIISCTTRKHDSSSSLLVEELVKTTTTVIDQFERVALLLGYHDWKF